MRERAWPPPQGVAQGAMHTLKEISSLPPYRRGPSCDAERRAARTLKFLLYVISGALIAILFGMLTAPAHAATIITQPDATTIFHSGSSFIGSFTATSNILAASTTAEYYSGQTSGTEENDIVTCLDMSCSAGFQTEWLDTAPATPNPLLVTKTGGASDIVNGTTYYVFYKSFGSHTQTKGDSSSKAFVLIYNGSPTDTSITKVIQFESPALYATTTSPVVTTFEYQIGTEDFASSVSGYSLEFTNSLTGQFKRVYGSLNNSFAQGDFTQTATTTLPTSGTWKAVANLNNYDPSVPTSPSSSINKTATTYFGIDHNDNVSEVDFGPDVSLSFASTSCNISFSSGINIGDCAGYLFYPASTTIQKFGTLTLANSFPFSYAYEIGSLRNALFTSTSTATTSISVTVGTSTGAWHITFLSEDMLAAIPLAGTVKTILALLLWFMLAELIYYQVIRSHDDTTPR